MSKEELKEFIKDKSLDELHKIAKEYSNDKCNLTYEHFCPYGQSLYCFACMFDISNNELREIL